MEAETLALAQEIDFSMWGLFARATVTVKLVMLMLVGASIWSWGIIIQKMINYRLARREADAFDRAFWSGNPLDELFDQVGSEPPGQAARIFSAGMTEWRRSHRSDGGLIPGAQARIDRSMDVAIAKETEGLQSGLSVLATVGSTAPFIGLVGRHALGVQGQRRAELDEHARTKSLAVHVVQTARHDVQRGVVARRGAEGDAIRIMNLASRSTITGTVSGPGVVSVP